MIRSDPKILKALRKNRVRVNEATERYVREMKAAKELQADADQHRYRTAIAAIGDAYSAACDKAGDEFDREVSKC